MESICSTVSPVPGSWSEALPRRHGEIGLDFQPTKPRGGGLRPPAVRWRLDGVARSNAAERMMLVTSSSGTPRCLLAGEAPEHGRKRHAEASAIAVAEHIRRHDHAGREHIVCRP